MKKYDESQEGILQMANYENLPLKKYVNPDFTEEEMLAILEGLRAEVNIEVYAKREFNYLQMLLIKELLETKFDGIELLQPEMPFSKMVVVTKFISGGHNPKPYLEKGLTASQMETLLDILNQENNGELLEYAEYSNYNICVMKSLLIMNIAGIDVKKLIDNGRFNFCGVSSMFQPKPAAIIEKSITRGSKLINYATSSMTPEQLSVIEESLSRGINPEQFASSLYSHQQMRYIMDCIDSGKDITYILKPDLSLSDMEMIINEQK